MAKNGRKALLSEMAGDLPVMATADSFFGAVPVTSGRMKGLARASPSLKPDGETRFNLKSVTDALLAAGMDPAVEIIRILQKEDLVIDRNGNIKMDPATGKPIKAPAVDSDTRMRMMNELLMYTQPKLKAVEVKLSGSVELTNDQLDDRLKVLLAKAAK